MSDGLKLDLCAIDNGRFEDVIHTLDVKPICGECDYFNSTIQDPDKRYRCHTTPACIAATLHPRLQSYLQMKLGWIDQRQHLENLGTRNPKEPS
jgi:hypothetical protein